MLPPVPATSVALQANQRQASAPRTEPSSPVAEENAVPAVPLRIAAGPTSSLDMLDLSGQLRLGQSLSVFAETLGSILQLPRREGEALADYSKRLAAAIDALSASDRIRLQAQLNQIMQGATLRLLAELLKDPSGPAAARLAAQIEIAQYHETDLAARNAVSFYRQNNGIDTTRLPANTNLAADTGSATSPPTTTGDSKISGSAQQSTSGDQDTLTRILKDGAASSKAAAEPGQSAAPAEADDPAGRTSGKSLIPGQVTANNTRAAAPGSEPSKLPGDAATTRAETAAIPATVTDAAEAPEAELKMRTPPQPTGNAAATTFTAAGTSELTRMRGDAAPGTAAHGTAAHGTAGTIYDAAALARRAHAEGSPHGRQSVEAAVDHFVTEWISESLSDKPEAREPGQPLAGRTPLQDTSRARQILQADGDVDAAKSRIHSERTSDDQTVLVQPNSLPTPAAISTATKAAQHTDSAFEKALLGMMAPSREPPAHPLVPHAGAQEFDDRQDHDIKRKPAVGDDGQPSRQGFGGGQFSQGEERPAQEDAPAETVLSQIDAEAPADLDTQAEQPRFGQAPQQHLSSSPANDLAPGAEDFYRRMAVLE